MISIIIPVHNARRNLETCLRRVLVSSCRDYEIIVVDDCSDDGSGQAARKYTENIIGLNKKSGPAVARNAGSKRAKGEVLLFIDSDILIMKDTLHRIADFLNENKDIDGVTSLHVGQPLFLNFCSQYKYLYYKY